MELYGLPLIPKRMCMSVCPLHSLYFIRCNRNDFWVHHILVMQSTIALCADKFSNRCVAAQYTGPNEEACGTYSGSIRIEPGLSSRKYYLLSPLLDVTAIGTMMITSKAMINPPIIILIFHFFQNLQYSCFRNYDFWNNGLYACRSGTKYPIE